MLSSSETSNLPLETLQEGDQGSTVAKLQKQLNELDLYHGHVSGQFDLQTKAALQSFQSQHGLKAEDGVFGPQTWYALTFWERETEWPVPALWTALNGWLVKLIDSAAIQPEPMLTSQAKQPKEVTPGQLLFWPLGRKNRGVA